MDAGTELENLVASLQQNSAPQLPLGEGALPSNDQEVYYFFKDPSNEEYYVTNSLSCLAPDDAKTFPEKETLAAVAPPNVLDMMHSLPGQQGVGNSPLVAFHTYNTLQSDREMSGESMTVPLEALLGCLSLGKSGSSEGTPADPPCGLSTSLMSEGSVYMDSICGVESQLSDLIPEKSLEVDDLYSNLKQVGLVTSPVKQSAHSTGAEAVVDSLPLDQGLNRPGLLTTSVMKQPGKPAKKTQKNADNLQAKKSISVKKTKSLARTKSGTKPPKSTRKQKKRKHKTSAQNSPNDTTEEYSDEDMPLSKYKVASKHCKFHKVQTLLTPSEQNARRSCKYQVSKNHRKVIYGTVALSAFVRRNKAYVSTAELLQRKIIRMPARQLHRIFKRLSIVTLPATEEELFTLKLLHVIAWQTRNNELVPCSRLRTLAKYIHTELDMGGRDLLSISKCSVQIVNPRESSSSFTSEGDISEHSDGATEWRRKKLPLVGITLNLADSESSQDSSEGLVADVVDVDVSIPKSVPKVTGRFVHCSCCMHRNDSVPNHLNVKCQTSAPASGPPSPQKPRLAKTKPFLRAAGPLPPGQFSVSDSGAMQDFFNRLGIDPKTNVTALLSFPTAPTTAGLNNEVAKDDKNSGVDVQKTSPDSTSWHLESNPHSNPLPNPERDLLQYTVDAVFGKDNFGLTSPDEAVPTESSDVSPTSPPYRVVLSADNSSQSVSLVPSPPVATGNGIGLTSPDFTGRSTCSSPTHTQIEKVNSPQSVQKYSGSRVTAKNKKFHPMMQTLSSKDSKVLKQTKSKKAKPKKPCKPPVASHKKGQCINEGEHSGSGSPAPVIPAVVGAREAPVSTNTCMASGGLEIVKGPVENLASLGKPNVKGSLTHQLPVAEELIQATTDEGSICSPACGQKPNFQVTTKGLSSPLPLEDQNAGTSQSSLTSFADDGSDSGGKTELPLNPSKNACLELGSGSEEPTDLEIPCDRASRLLGSVTDNSFSMLEEALITAAQQAAANEASPDSGVSKTVFPETKVVSTCSPSPVRIPSSVDTTGVDFSHVPLNMVSQECSGNNVGNDVEEEVEYAEAINSSSEGQNFPEKIFFCEKNTKLCPVVSVSPVKLLVEASSVLEEVVCDNVQGIKFQKDGVCVERPMSPEADVSNEARVAASSEVGELSDPESTSQHRHLNDSSENDAPSPSPKICNDATCPSAKVFNSAPCHSAKVYSDARRPSPKFFTDASNPSAEIHSHAPHPLSEGCNDGVGSYGEVFTWQKPCGKRELSIDGSDKLSRLVEKIVAMETPECPGSVLHDVHSTSGVSMQDKDKSLGAGLRSLPDSAQPPTAAIEKMWRPYLPKVIVGGNGSIKLNMVLMKTPQNKSLLESQSKLRYLCYVFARMIAREVKAGHINYVEPALAGSTRSRHKRGRKSPSSRPSSGSGLRVHQKKEGAAKKASQDMTAAGEELVTPVSLREQQAQLCPRNVRVSLGGNKFIQKMLKNNASSMLLPPSDGCMWIEPFSHLICADKPVIKSEASGDYQDATSDSEVQFRVSRIPDHNERGKKVLKFVRGRKPISQGVGVPGKNTYRGKANSGTKKGNCLGLPNLASKYNQCHTSSDMNTTSVENVASVNFGDRAITITRCSGSVESSFSVEPEKANVRKSQFPSWQVDKSQLASRKRKQPKLPTTRDEQLASLDKSPWTTGEKVVSVSVSDETVFDTKFLKIDKPFCSPSAENIGISLGRGQMVKKPKSCGKGFKKELALTFTGPEGMKESGKQKELSTPVVKRKVGRPRKNKQHD